MGRFAYKVARKLAPPSSLAGGGDAAGLNVSSDLLGGMNLFDAN